MGDSILLCQHVCYWDKSHIMTLHQWLDRNAHVGTNFLICSRRYLEVLGLCQHMAATQNTSKKWKTFWLKMDFDWLIADSSNSSRNQNRIYKRDLYSIIIDPNLLRVSKQLRAKPGCEEHQNNARFSLTSTGEMWLLHLKYSTVLHSSLLHYFAEK